MKLTKKHKDKIKKKLLKKGLEIVREAKLKCPVRTGRLRASIHTETEGYTIKVGTNVKYAPYIEYGTEPHEIKPKDKEALRWFDENDNPVFAKSVDHPGTQAQPFLRPAIDKVLRGG